jgi:hypothetical protein
MTHLFGDRSNARESGPLRRQDMLQQRVAVASPDILDGASKTNPTRVRACAARDARAAE